MWIIIKNETVLKNTWLNWNNFTELTNFDVKLKLYQIYTKWIYKWVTSAVNVSSTYVFFASITFLK